MRFKVVVTKVEVAELWVRATDEEAAAQKVKEELKTTWAYAGHWERQATQVDVIESDSESDRSGPARVGAPGPMLLKLKDAATELGIPYGTLHALTMDGGIEYTKVGSRKYISRASLAAFVEANTQR